MWGNKYTTGRQEPGNKAREQAVQSKGYDPDADAYVYVLSFERTADEVEFAYVGQVTGGRSALKREVARKARHPAKISKPVIRQGKEVMESHSGTYEFSQVHRIQSYNYLSRPEVLYEEWKARGEIILNWDTINVLGGR